MDDRVDGEREAGALEGGGGPPLVHVLNAGLLVGLWWWSWWVFPSLPEHIPGHIGPGGIRWDEATLRGWMVLPMVAAGMTALNYGLGPVIRRTRKVNLPGVAFEDLLPGDQEEVLDLTVRFLQWMNVILLAGFVLLQVGSWETAIRGAEQPALTTVLGIVFLMLVPSLASVGFLILVLRAVGDAEARARAATLDETGNGGSD